MCRVPVILDTECSQVQIILVHSVRMENLYDNIDGVVFCIWALARIWYGVLEYETQIIVFEVRVSL